CRALGQGAGPQQPSRRADRGDIEAGGTRRRVPRRRRPGAALHLDRQHLLLLHRQSPDPFRNLRPAEDAGSAGGSSPARDRRHPRLSAARRRDAFHTKSKSMKITDIPATPPAALRKSGVIPAHPLALDASRKLDERHQRALSRYYLDAGAIGLEIGRATSELQSRENLVCRLLLEKKK